MSECVVGWLVGVDERRVQGSATKTVKYRHSRHAPLLQGALDVTGAQVVDPADLGHLKVVVDRCRCR